MSKQALDGFRAKLTEDQALREKMTRALSTSAGKSSASLDDVVAFAKACGYAFSPDEVRETLELSDEQLAGVTGGAFNGFANFGDIKGESTDKDHKDWITILSYNRP
jgi:predicted ribosomally synthesized peptide with nif11-like leader